MLRDDAADLARYLMDYFDLRDWRFMFDRAKRRAGSCRYGVRIITLSTYFVDANPIFPVDQTIRHEIAHAKVSPDRGHDAVWRAMARHCGTSDKACYDASEVVMPKGPWRADCACGSDHHRHRRPAAGRRYYCRATGETLTWRKIT